MLNIILFLTTAMTATLVMAGLLSVLFKKQLAMSERVNQYFGETSITIEQEKKLKQNPVLKNYWEKGVQKLNRKASRQEQKRIDIMLRDAGYPFKTATDFRLFQLILAGGLSVPVFLFMFPASENKAMAILLCSVVAMLGFRYPVFYLGKKKTQRIKEINKAMPDFFDTVNLLLEAGLGLDAAIAQVCKKSKSPLSEEFIRTLEDMKLGKSRREAFYELRKRIPSDSFQSIITSLIQADQLGIGMAKVLGNLTTRVREQRREAAREQAMKAPVKMLFPMVFFIFPALFIVILGPMAVQLVTKGLGG